ncbi:MAG TPA: DUF971 domain-containing protein [Nitrososphaerales archaeon]|nr:DUF971 domain-containing protein [Nitrososphaerales archaeon]
MPNPKAVSLGDREVRVDWSDGHRSVFSNKTLREACPCAGCAGEGAPLGGRAFIPLKVAAPEDIRATQYSRVGLYALAFAWSDGHSTGIYPYDYLLGLCECDACLAKRAAQG